MQIRWRWLNSADTVPAFHDLDFPERRIHFDHSDDREIDVVIYRFVMVEGNLGASASGVLPRWRLFRFAMAVRRAATLRPSEREILLAGDAATPDKGGEEKQGKKRTGQSPAHHYLIIAKGP